MTDLESREVMSMMKTDSNDLSINKSLSLTSMETSVSDITADETGEQTWKIIEPNYDLRYLTKIIFDSVTISSKLNLNFSTDRAAKIARRLLHDHDILDHV